MIATHSLLGAPAPTTTSALSQVDARHLRLTVFGPGKFRQSSFWVLLWGCGSVLSGVHSRALDGPTAAARLSIAFLSNKKGTHEKDMGEGPLLERLGG